MAPAQSSPSPSRQPSGSSSKPHAQNAPPQPPAALCIRHGLTNWNAAFRWQGRADVALAEEGIAQAERAADALARLPFAFDVVGCSTLVRARHTAEIIAGRLGLEVAIAEERLVERDIGEWSGLTTTEIETRWPGMLDDWRNNRLDQTPGGEREADMTVRVTAGLTDLLATLAKNGGRALVVTHGGVLHTFDDHFGQKPRPYDNLEGRWFGWDGTAVLPGPSVTLDPSAVRRRSNAL
jgi:broad specificity phosphatase PhoE